MRQLEQQLFDLTEKPIEIVDFGRWLSSMVEVKYYLEDGETQEASIDKIEICAAAQMLGIIDGYTDEFITDEKMIGLDDSVTVHVHFWDWFNEVDYDLKEKIFIECLRFKAKSAWLALSKKRESKEIKNYKAATAA